MVQKKKALRLALGSDHAGFPTKEKLIKPLIQEGYLVFDFGAHSDKPSDYPDYAFHVAKAVANKVCDRGLLVCGSGLGMAIAANKVKGIRAAAVWSVKTAKLASEHNGANVLCLSNRLTSHQSIRRMIKTWLKTPFDKGGRHERRVRKITRFESIN